jgi:RNA polymerase sigma factor (sigma-70 family)
MSEQHVAETSRPSGTSAGTPRGKKLAQPDQKTGDDVAVLLAAARSGRRDALNGLIREYMPVLWHVARAQGLNRTDSEDVVQTTWLRLLRASDTIRNPEALLGWLVAVARREAWRVRELRCRESLVDERDLDQSDERRPGVEDGFIENERDRVLWQAVHHLPARCQELLRLVAFVSRPNYGAVAQALGMRVGSVGPTRGRCLAKLRTALRNNPQWSEQ